MGGRFEDEGAEDEEGTVDLENVVGMFVEEREVVSCAKDELGRIKERKRVEESGKWDREQWQTFLARLDFIFLIEAQTKKM